MKKTVTALSVAVLAAFGSQAVLAQSASSPSREEVKKATAEANKSGQIPGSGVSNVPADAAGSQSPKQKAATSTTTRADRKAATAEANKAGQIPGSTTGGTPSEATTAPKQ